jgi:hypothetical protein
MLVVVALFLSWVTAWTQTGGRAPAADTATTFRQLTQDRFDANARNDRAFYDRLLAPHFVVLLPNAFPAHTRCVRESCRSDLSLAGSNVARTEDQIGTWARILNRIRP